MDKIVLIVNGRIPVSSVSNNTILIQNTGDSPDNVERARRVMSSDPVPKNNQIDLEIKDPHSGKITKLSEMISKEA